MRLLSWSVRIVWVVLFGLLAASAFAGCSGGGSTPSKRIIVLTNGDSPFWDAGNAGVKSANAELKLGDPHLEAVMERNQGGPEGQLDKLRQYLTQSDIAALAISPCDAKNKGVADQLRKLKDKGVKIVTLDSDLDRATLRDARFAFIGTDNLAAGRELGKCLRYLRPEGGTYVTFVGRTGAQNAIERIQGIQEGAGDKWRSLDSMADDEDRNRAQTNVREAVKKNPRPDAMVGIWSYNAPQIVKVIAKEMNRRKDFVIAVFDAEPSAIADMTDGSIDVMVVQNPYQMGYQSIRLLKAMIQNDEKTIKEMLPNQGKPDGDVYDTGLKIVVADQGSPLEAHRDKFDKTTQFLRQGDFRKWLDQYQLTGS